MIKTAAVKYVALIFAIVVTKLMAQHAYFAQTHIYFLSTITKKFYNNQSSVKIPF